MSISLEQSTLETIQQYDVEQRFKYLIKEAVSNGEIWVLSDEQGSVMLNTDDEDCVPVWPNKEFAQAWATGDWEGCKAESISLKNWHDRWTPGLEDDEFAVVVFPNENQDGLVVSPADLDFELKKQAMKQG
ncbi:MAG: DUF2750 domain-containing protein [Amphritea sp.]